MERDGHAAPIGMTKMPVAPLLSIQFESIVEERGLEPARSD
jgi:hypothetical protein